MSASTKPAKPNFWIDSELRRGIFPVNAASWSRHWEAHCDTEGFGPANLMRRLETGIGADYPGYYSGAFASLNERLAATEAVGLRYANENEALTQQLAAAKGRVEMLEEWLRRYGADC